MRFDLLKLIDSPFAMICEGVNAAQFNIFHIISFNNSPSSFPVEL
jgi:hypothetical protein